MNEKLKKSLKKEIVKIPFESPSCFIPPNFETQMFLRLFCGQEVTGLVGRQRKEVVGPRDKSHTCLVSASQIK